MKVNVKRIVVMVLIASVLGGVIIVCGNTIVGKNDSSSDVEETTWEEFNSMSAEEQIAFQDSFSDIEAFDDWMQSVQPQPEMPWDNGGKQPEDYTWEEFEALPAEQQMAFQESFGGFEEFDNWMQEATYEEIPAFSASNGKSLEDYTWEEFENMSDEDQIRFQDSFDSFEDFDKWLQNAQKAAGIES